VVSRSLRAAGAVGTALWLLTACGGEPAVCELVDVVPEVSVTWRAAELPYGEASTYRLCVGTRCESGTPRAYGDGLRVVMHLPDDFDERRPRVDLRLSGPTGTPKLDESRTITLRDERAGCDQALTGALRLTADGVLEEPDKS
jgi:hypothetical protein